MSKPRMLTDDAATVSAVVTRVPRGRGPDPVRRGATVPAPRDDGPTSVHGCLATT